jgi:hypothetical protein
MVNSGSVNGEPVHASHHILTDVLRGQLHFEGVVISDWQDVENLIGSEGGAAVADALFGKVNPSGRLPVSWPRDSSTFPLAYNEPGRPYDPRYPFGHGLSYTRFKLSDLRAPWHADAGRRITASVDVANVGRSWGANTVLAFLVSGDASRGSWPSIASRPARTAATRRA